MSALIEQLKHNTTVHGELSAEAQKCFKEVGPKNCLVRWNNIWERASRTLNRPFYPDYTYRIKADYQPEPEIEWCVVTATGGGPYSRLGFRYRGAWHRLGEAVDFPEFHGGKYANGRITTEIRARWDFPEVNKKPAEWPEYVGFMKE